MAGGWGPVSGAGLAGTRPGGDYNMAQPAVTSRCEFEGELYAGTLADGPCEVWRPRGSQWSRVNTPGFRPGIDDLNAANLGATSTAAFGAHLYAGI